jgi:cell division protein ZipA
MELVSLIIMGLGIIALIAIFFLSRASQPKSSRKRDETVNVVRDPSGIEMSSVLHDNPARDGKRPSTQARNLSHDMLGESHTAAASTAPNVGAPVAVNAAATLPAQLVLFVASDDSHGFDGEQVLVALQNNDLSFGDMGIFHRLVLTPNGEQALFSVANGVKPWTLIPEDLIEASTPGLSLILNLPAPIPTQEAVHDFLHTAENLTQALDGVLKDQQQQIFTLAMRNQLLALAQPVRA